MKKISEVESRIFSTGCIRIGHSNLEEDINHSKKSVALLYKNAQTQNLLQSYQLNNTEIIELYFK